MEKIITFCVPSYNSESFLHVALDSLIPGGEEIEVLVVDDGSKDGTFKVAQEYEAKYPNIFKAVHQENKGHGGAINTALSMASGKFFKVLDSDDKVDEESLHKAIAFLKENGDKIDLLVMDYVYYHGWDKPTVRIGFRNVLKQNAIMEPKQIKRFGLQQNITLHTAMYKTEVIRASGAKLPEHCSYEDNYMVYAPMFHVRHLAYLHLPFYCYFIGRDGQSMQDDIIRKKYYDLIRCGDLIWNAGDLPALKKVDKKLYTLVRHHLRMNFAYAFTFCQVNGSEQARQDMIDFIERCKTSKPEQWKAVKGSIQYKAMGKPTKFGRKRAMLVYRLARKLITFN